MFNNISKIVRNPTLILRQHFMKKNLMKLEFINPNDHFEDQVFDSVRS